MDRDHVKQNVKENGKKRIRSRDASDTVYLGRIYSLLERIENYSDWINDLVDPYIVDIKDDDPDIMLSKEGIEIMDKDSYFSYLRRMDRSIDALEKLISPDIQYRSRKTMKEKENSNELLHEIMFDLYTRVSRRPMFFKLLYDSGFENVKRYFDKSFEKSVLEYE